MKILLDECIDRRFRDALPMHEVLTVQEIGRAGMKKGELLRVAEAEFEALVTVDAICNFSRMRRKSEFPFLSCVPD